MDPTGLDCLADFRVDDPPVTVKRAPLDGPCSSLSYSSFLSVGYSDALD